MIRSGRSNLGGQAFSRLDFPCIVPNCGLEARSDALKRHYLSWFKFSDDGQPLKPDDPNYVNLNPKQKSHTDYFRLHSFSKFVLPEAKRPSNVNNSIRNWFQAANPIEDSDSGVADSMEDRDSEVVDSGEDLHSGAVDSVEDLHSEAEVSDHGDIDSEPPPKRTRDWLYDDDIEIDSNLTDDIETGHSIEHERVVVDQSVENDSNNNSLETAVPKSALVKEISDSIIERLGIPTGMSLKDTVVEAVKQSLVSKEKDSSDDSNEWIEGENGTQVCVSCLNLSTLEIPHNLKSLHKGKFGTIHSDDPRERKRRKESHEASPLHKWCIEQVENRVRESSEAQVKNKKAASLITTNAAYCFLTGGSAEDFVRLNNKDALTEDLMSATKNDGKQEFHSFRELFFLKLSDLVKSNFKDKIKTFSVTLDKVTVQRVPYCVLLTYFFHEGRIYILLNSVHRMTSQEGDSEGTARRVVTILMETLGLTISGLRSKCHHFAYDGVYCT